MKSSNRYWLQNMLRSVQKDSKKYFIFWTWWRCCSSFVSRWTRRKRTNKKSCVIEDTMDLIIFVASEYGPKNEQILSWFYWKRSDSRNPDKMFRVFWGKTQNTASESFVFLENVDFPSKTAHKKRWDSRIWNNHQKSLEKYIKKRMNSRSLERHRIASASDETLYSINNDS